MNTPITLTFGFDRKLFPRAIMAFWYSTVPRPSLSYRLVFWLAVWLAIFGAIITVGTFKIPATAAGVGGVIIFGLWILGLQRIRMARFYNALGAHWDRTGDMTARFDADGVLLEQTGSRMEFAWNTVDDIVRARGGTVFRIGMSMIAIPDSALPDDMNAKAFRAKLNDWKGA